MKKELSFRHRLVCAMPYSLIHFLISCGYFRRFIDNACNPQAEGKNKSLLAALENRETSEHKIICNAFIWNDTPEKYDFWFRIDLLYDRYLEDLANIK